MQVFVIERHVQYEFGDVIAVFSTQQKADDGLVEILKQKHIDKNEWSINPYDVDEWIGGEEHL